MKGLFAKLSAIYNTSAVYKYFEAITEALT